MNFVHLHVHSEYSILDGIGKVPEIVHKAKRLGMKAVALTDHGNVSGHFQLIKACQEEKIKPILGCEFYFVDELKREKGYDHLLVLAKNSEGAKNLLRLSNLGQIKGFYYRPRICWEDLIKYRKGLIVLSGCLQGRIAKKLLKGNFREASFEAMKIKQWFGKDFYLEMIFLEMPQTIKLNYQLVKLSKATKIPLVVTCDSHYIEKENKKLQDVVLLLKQHKTFKDLKKNPKGIFLFSTKELWLKSRTEIEKSISKFNPKIPKAITEKALNRTLEIAENIEEITLDTSPKFPVFKANGDLNKLLLIKAKRGWKSRNFSKKTHPEYFERIKREYRVITQKGFASYFLILADIVSWAKKKKILVGDGRGSAAGSLLSYLLGITNVDPIKWELLFERFYNIDRATPPDIDIDFDHLGRDKINEYIKKRYKRVIGIGSYGMMGLKMVMKDVGRVFGLDFNELNYLTNKLDTGYLIFSKKELLKINPLLQEYKEKSTLWNEVIEIALKLRGQIRHISEHPAGIIISGVPLLSSIPIQRHRNKLITGWTEGIYGKEVTGAGFLKYDILGLKTLSSMKRTIRLIEKRYGKKIDFYSMELNDHKVYKELSKGNSVGVFTFETSSARNILKMIKPTKFEHLIAVNSLDRPAPLKSSLHEIYADRKNNPQARAAIHPYVDKFLKKTYGTVIFQEQVMELGTKIGNFTAAENDLFRKSSMKRLVIEDSLKKAEQIRNRLKVKFIRNAVKKIPRKVAEKVWNLMEVFTKYGFNRSHSCSYAMLSYKAMYFKCHYPKEFFAGILEYCGSLDKVKWYLEDAQRQGLKVYPISINKSKTKFKIVKDGIRYPFLKLKGVGIKKAELIKDNQPYESFQDFLERMYKKGKTGRKLIETLIQAGAFDGFGRREKIFNQLENYKSREKIPLEFWSTSDAIRKEIEVYGFKFPSSD